MKEQEKQRLSQLETELRNTRTSELDTLATSELLQVLHQENHAVPAAIDPILATLADLVDKIAERLQVGGRIIYVGAGTSGRLGVLDASECPPTFGVSPDMVQGIIAGGHKALVSSIEGAEDNKEQGKLDLAERNPDDKDTVIGIAASGRTPYVIGALDFARSRGCITAGIANVSNSALAQHVDFVLEAVTGSEPLTGSTRMKAGTAQKLILNLISTAVMVRIGKVYQNLMVDVKATNEKLKHRAVRIVQEATSAPGDICEAALEKSDWHAKTAIVSILLNTSAEQATELLERNKGHLRPALAAKSK
ncbi:MAG: N-acetylmuramic acid 6-phosphate etherase [Candidatus Obscuribacterales bacterium]|nr:N-acetylmuramic acid 6-phosphate etherase [Candidatus Obscuribacterales bacterium]